MKDTEDLNQSNSGSGMWPLCAASIANNLDACRALLENGADPNYQPEEPGEEWPWPGALHQAVYNDSESIVELLIGYGVDVDSPRFIYNDDYVRFNFDINPLSALVLAVYLRHWAAATSLIKSGAKVCSQAFRLAVQSGNLEIVESMTNRQLAVDIINHCFEGKTPLELALENRDTEMCEFLSTNPAIVFYERMLPQAAACGSMKLIHRVLRCDATSNRSFLVGKAIESSLDRHDMEAFDVLFRETESQSLSPVQMTRAFGSCSIETIHDLTSRFPNWSTKETGHFLESALSQNSEDVVAFVLEKYPLAYSSASLCAIIAGAFGTDTPDRAHPIHEMLGRRQMAEKELLDPFLESTALALAAHQKLPMHCLLAILHRYEIGATDIIPETRSWAPEASFSATPGITGGVPHATAKLIEERVPDWRYWQTANKFTLLPLHLAVDSENFPAITAMLDHGFKNDGRTIKFAIVQRIDLTLLKALINSCEDLEYRGHFDSPTPLQLAIDLHHTAAITALISGGADVNASHYKLKTAKRAVMRVRNGTALQAAIEYMGFDGDTSLVKQLLAAGADINAPAYVHEGATALQIAAGLGRIGLVRYMIELGADLNAERGLLLGATCLEWASAAGRLDMVQYLLDAGVNTIGKGRLQYIRSIRSAPNAAIEQILRRHRPWDNIDEALFSGSLGKVGYQTLYRVILHPLEKTSQEIEIAKHMCRTYYLRWDAGDQYGSTYKFWPEDWDALEVDEADLDFWNIQYCDGIILENPSKFQQAANGVTNNSESLVPSENRGMHLHTRFRESESVDFHEEPREFGQGQALL